MGIFDTSKLVQDKKIDAKAAKTPFVPSKPKVNTIKPVIPKKDIKAVETMKEAVLTPQIKPLLNTSAAQSAMSLTSATANRPIGTPTAAPIASNPMSAGFQYGAASAFGGTKMGEGAIGRNLADKQAENEDVFNKAKIGGQFAGTAAQYSVANQAVKAIPKLAGLSASKQILPTIGVDQLIDNVVQTPRVIAQGRDQGKTGSEIGMDVLKQNATDLAINTGMALGGRAIGLVADILKKRGKPIAEALTDTGIIKEIEEVTGTKQGTPEFNQLVDEYKTVEPKPIKGKYQYDNKSKEIMDELEEKILDVQNHFGTNELRASEQARIKPELGIDFDDINKRLDFAERPLKEVLQEESILPSATKENARLAKVAGIELPKIKGAENVKPMIEKVEPVKATEVVEEAAKSNAFDLQIFSKKEFESKAKMVKQVKDVRYFEIDGRQYTGKNLNEAYDNYVKSQKVQGVKPSSKQSNVKPDAKVQKIEKSAQTATGDVTRALTNKPSLKRGSKKTKAEILTDYKSKQKAQEAAKDWKAVEKQSDKIQADVDRVEAINNKYNDGGSGERFSEQINYDKKKPKKSFKQTWDEFKRDFVDDLSAFEKAEKGVFGKVQSAEKSFYKTGRNEKRAINLAERIIDSELQPILKGVESSGKSYRDLGEYALAVHARDVNAKGLVSGFDNSDIAKKIAELGTPEMEVARKELVNISKRLLEIMEESGLLSKGQVAAMLEKHPNYMPLFRHFDETSDFAKGFGDSFSKSDAPIFALKGSEKQVNDPIENMMKNIYRSVDAAKKNDVGVQLVRLAEADTKNAFARIVEQGENIDNLKVVSTMIDGKKVQIEVEPELYKAFTGMNKEAAMKIWDILAKPASVLRAGATLTPEFAARNPMRDMVEAFTKSESGFNPVTDFPRGIASVIKKDEYYDLWLRSGGGGTGIMSHDIRAHRKGLLEGFKQPIQGKIITIFKPNTYLDVLRKMSEITEEATRVGEFRKALKGGATPQEAAFRSADLMDFTRSGANVRQINRVVAFFNANIQGKSKLIRAIKANPKEASVKAVTSMAIPTVAIFGYNQNFSSDKQKQIIADAPEWQRNTFWLIASPFDDEYVIRIPKPFELAIVANATERFMEFAVKQDEKAFDGFLGQTIKDQGMPIMPTGLIPIMEGATNYSMFRQTSIIPERERYVKKENQHDYNTSEVSKGIAKGIRAVAGEDSNFSSPRVVDYMIKSGTGGLGTYALDGTDFLLDSLGLVDRPKKPKKDITQQPLVKGFMVNSLSSGKSVGKIYDVSSAYEREKKTLRDELGDSYKDNKDYVKLHEESKKVDVVADRMSEISKEIRTINNDKKKSAEKKKSEIKKLTDERNDIAYEFSKELEKAKWFKERGIN